MDHRLIQAQAIFEEACRFRYELARDGGRDVGHWLRRNARNADEALEIINQIRREKHDAPVHR